MFSFKKQEINPTLTDLLIPYVVNNNNTLQSAEPSKKPTHNPVSQQPTGLYKRNGTINPKKTETISYTVKETASPNVIIEAMPAFHADKALARNSEAKRPSGLYKLNRPNV